MSSQVPNAADKAQHTPAEEPHHPECPSTDGFGCRCDEIYHAQRRLASAGPLLLEKHKWIADCAENTAAYTDIHVLQQTIKDIAREARAALASVEAL